jgi:DNA-binding transcriptional regulator LsrR (DeoR family)
MMAEECQQLFDLLQDESLVKVAVLKLEGWTNEEIATELGYTRRTIQRMLATIELFRRLAAAEWG